MRRCGTRRASASPANADEANERRRRIMNHPPLSALLHWFDLRPEPPLPGYYYGTWVFPTSPIPFDEPERPRRPERVPPLVSPSWERLAASLASRPGSTPCTRLQ